MGANGGQWRPMGANGGRWRQMEADIAHAVRLGKYYILPCRPQYAVSQMPYVMSHTIYHTAIAYSYVM
eukprot:1195248-Lingulodinium_polyedra.AAC.1